MSLIEVSPSISVVSTNIIRSPKIALILVVPVVRSVLAIVIIWTVGAVTIIWPVGEMCIRDSCITGRS